MFLQNILLFILLFPSTILVCANSDGSWSQPWNSGQEVAYHTVVSWDNGQSLLSFGGSYQNPNSNPVCSNYVQQYDFQQNSWSLLQTTGDIPTARRKHTAVTTADNTMLVFGGSTTNGKYLNDLYQFDETNEWQLLTPTGNAPSPRISHKTVIYGNQMFIFGGQGPNGFFNDLYSYDIQRNVWKSIKTTGSKPVARSSHSMVLTSSGIALIFGGLQFHGSFGYLNDLYQLDLNLGVWSPLDPSGLLPSPRAQHSAVLTPDGRYMIIFGGYDNEGYYTNDIWKYDIVANEWIWVDPLGQPPLARFAHGCVPLGSSMLIYGGYNDALGKYPGYLNQIAIYQLPSEP